MQVLRGTSVPNAPTRAWFAGVVLVALLLAAAFAGWLAPHSPDAPYPARALTDLGLPIGPTAEFPLGADSIGRCELSRLLFGARVSLAVAFLATAIVVLVGTTVGILAGYLGGWVDTALSRVVDALLAFPFLMVVMAINKAVARPGLWITFVVLGLFAWTGLARQVRSKTQSLRHSEFVIAARALGAPTRRIVLRHLLPNILPIVLVVATTLVADMMLAESALSYLGVGVVAPTASWGAMLRDAEPLMRASPALTVFPAVCILVTVTALNVLATSPSS